MSGTNGNDSLNGGTGDDTLEGLGGNDTLNGRAGHDYLDGGDGNDRLNGEGGNDTLWGGSGTDTLLGGADHDMLYADRFDSVDGGAGTDYWEVDLTGAGAQTLTLNGTSIGLSVSPVAANMEFIGVTLAQGSIANIGVVAAGVWGVNGEYFVNSVTFAGTGGRLNLDWSSRTVDSSVWVNGSSYGIVASTESLYTSNVSSSSVTTGGGADQIYGAAGQDTLNGGAGDDEISGGGGDDSLIGGSGDDTLRGDAGRDTLLGGSGDDVIYAERQDSVDGGTGADVWDVDLSADGVQTLTLSVTSIALSVSPLATNIEYLRAVLAQGSTANVGVVTGSYLGGAGEFYGHSVSFAGTGGRLNLDWSSLTSDAFVQSGGESYTDFPEGAYFSASNVSSSSITTGSGDDIIYGAAGQDTLNGGAGADYIAGGDGNDSLSGGADHDRLYGGAGDDSLVGGAGDDTLFGEPGRDTLQGGTGDDVLYADRQDSVDGGTGTDVWDVDLSGDGAQTLTLAGTSIALSVSPLATNVEYLRAVLAQGSTANIGLVSGSYLGSTGEYYSHSVSFAGLGGRLNLDWSSLTTSAYVYLQGWSGPDSFTSNDGFYSANVSASSVVTGAGADQITGWTGQDTLDGGAGSDAIAGGEGNDSLIGGADDDQLYGEAGGDTLSGGAGDDTLDGGANIDTISYAEATQAITFNLGVTTAQNTGGAGTDTATNFENVLGGSGNDSLIGNAGSNRLTGGVGDDTLIGLNGNDTLDGGDGIDTAAFGTSTTGFVANLGITTAQVTNAGTDTFINIENLSGGNGNDTLTGDANANRLDGNLGNDSLSGAAGDDLLLGGGGDDVLDGGADNDTASYAGITAAVTVSLAVITAQATGGAGSDTLLNLENLIGGSGNDSLSGNDAANRLEGGAGNDTLTDAGGNDTLLGDGGNDSLDAGAGDDILEGGEGDDTLRGGDGADTMRGGAGNDRFEVGPGGFGATPAGEVMDGGSGNDTLFAYNATLDPGATLTSIETIHVSQVITLAAQHLVGVTSIISAPGWEAFGTTYQLHAASGGLFNLRDAGVADMTSFTGSDAAETVIGTDAGLYTLYGGGGDDSLVGGTGVNRLFGGVGNDTMEGGLGDDELWADAGNDVLDGGGGFDKAVYVNTRVTTTTWVRNTDGSLTITGVQDGTDTLRNVEVVEFNNGLLDAQTGIFTSSTMSIAGPAGQIAEGVSGTTPFTFTVTRTGNLVYAERVDWSVVGSGADAADFEGGVLPSGSLDFASGVTSQTITIQVLGDTTAEPDEGFSVMLTGGSFGVAIGTASASATIGNDDTSGSTALAITPLNADRAEGNAGPTAFTFTVTRSGDLSLAHSVSWATTGSGTRPAASADFTGGTTAQRGTLTFAAGETTQTITVQIAGDTRFEGDEGFTVTLSNPSSGVSITTATATGIIREDDIITGTAANDTLTGTSFADSIRGLAGDDVLQGSSGDDTIEGNEGQDTLVGGTGADSLIGGDGLDTASYFLAGAAVALSLTTGGTLGDAQGDRFQGIETVQGSAFADAITGDDQANLLVGNAGNDTLIGGAGDDTLQGGAGADSLVGGEGRDLLTFLSNIALAVDLNSGGTAGEAAGDVYADIEDVIGRASGDTLLGSAAANQLDGAGGDDLLMGREGNDTLIGGTGNDTLLGGAGDDSLAGGDGEDMVSYADALGAVTVSLALTGAQATGGAGLDVLSGFENLTGSGFADRLTGDGLANLLVGGAGNDTLVGGEGNDTLEGGGGGDVLTGGAGVDRFVFRSFDDSTPRLSGRDVITDFSRALQERIDLRQIDANPYLEGDQAFTWITGDFTGAAGELSVASFPGGTHRVRMDLDGDGAEDMAITVMVNIRSMAITDFFL